MSTPHPPPLHAATTFLFVPGDRPERYAKAAASGADAVVLDLEDAVAPTHKDAARAAVADRHAEAGPAVLRINPTGTPWHAEDVALAAELGVPVLVPKAAEPAALAALAEHTGGRCPLLPLVETALGLVDAVALLRSPGVVRAAFGSVDLAAELGVAAEDRLALGQARSALVLASAAAGVAPPLDGVTTALDAPEELDADVAHAVRLGFGGKLCIHPRQVPAVRAGFAPSREEVAWARRVLAAEEESPGVAVVDGRMVDRPVVARAHRLIERAET